MNEVVNDEQAIEDIEIIVEETEGGETWVVGEDGTPKSEQSTDDRVAASDDDDTDDDDDDSDDDERPQQAKKGDDSEIIKSLQAELAATQNKVAVVSDVLLKKEHDDFNAEYKRIQKLLEDCEGIHAEAISDGDGERAVIAMKAIDNCKNALSNMEYESQQTAENLKRQREQEELAARQYQIQKRHDDTTLRLREKWKKQFGFNKYDAKTQQLIKDIDDEYIQTTPYAPHDPRYWSGLTARIKEQTTENMNERRTMNSKVNNKKAKPDQIYISRERKEALIQAGVWDDPVLRVKYAKRYQEWDRDNRQR